MLFTEGSYKFARASLIDVLENASFSYKFEEYTIADLEYLHEVCNKLCYHESFTLSKDIKDINVTFALSAMKNGFSIGGAVWKVTVGSRSVVVAPNYRVKPRWYLDGCEKSFMSKADLLVTYDQVKPTECITYKHIHNCDDMKGIMATIAGTLRSHGSVLIPMNIGSSVIDLLLNLNTIWSNTDLQQYPIVLVSPIAVKLVLLYATCMEYLRASFCKSFVKTMWNPMFNMRAINPVSTLEELRKFTTIPCVFISTCPSLSFGITSYLFAALSSYERNSIIFTHESTEISKLLMKCDGEYSREAEFNHDFTLRLNLEPPEEADVEMSNADQRVTQDEGGEMESKGGAMTSFEDDVALEYMSKKSRNFVIVNGTPTYVPPKGIRDDMYNTGQRSTDNMDYGIPYNPVARSELDHNIVAMPFGMVVEDAQPHQSGILGAFSTPEQNPFNEYHRKHLDSVGMCGLKFEDDTGQGAEEGDKVAKVVTKRLPLVVKCSFYITRYFKQDLRCSELESLLRELRPRHVTVLPRNNDINRMNAIIHQAECAVDSHTEYHGYSTVLLSLRKTGSSCYTGFDRPVIIPFDMRQELVGRSTQFLLWLRGLLFNEGLEMFYTTSCVKNPRIEKLMKVLTDIDRWKAIYNPKRVYQAMLTIDRGEDEIMEERSTDIKCFAFWSESSTYDPLVSLCLGDMEEHQANNDEDDDDQMGMDEDKVTSPPQKLKHSIDHSLFAGGVGLQTFVNFMGDCLPDCVSIGNGAVKLNENLCVSKRQLRYGVGQWDVRGTLDPAFYFTRKMVRKLHNRLEPLY